LFLHGKIEKIIYAKTGVFTISGQKITYIKGLFDILSPTV